MSKVQAADLVAGDHVWTNDDSRVVRSATLSALTGSVVIEWTYGGTSVVQPSKTFDRVA